jgi:hypothetical protein
MRNLLLIFTLLLSTVEFSSSSYAEWRRVSKGVDGDTYYVDFERISKHDGYVYFSRLVNHLKPIQGYLSSKVCIQGDCKLFRLKYLSLSYHKKPMGGGAGDTHNYKNPEWAYPPPDTSIEYILERVCSKRPSRPFVSCEREMPTSSARSEW